MSENIFLIERMKAGYTQIEVAKKLRVSQSTISVLEADKTFGGYNFALIKRLCKLYGLNINNIPIMMED